MEQPFVVGKPVTGKYFINRESEIKKILALLAGTSKGNINNIILLGLRRTGKSSILANVKDALSKRKKVIPVLIDVYGMSTKQRFSKKLIDAVLQAYISETGDNAYKQRIKKLLGQTTEKLAEKISEFDVEVVEYVKFQIKLREPKVNEDELLECALQYAEKLAVDKKAYFVIMIDEFQDLLEWGDTFLKMFRRLVQAQKHVAYVFSGSAPTIMKELVYDTKSAFYKQLMEVHVNKIEKNFVATFVQNRLKSVKMSIDSTALDSMYQLSSGFPDYIQRLGLQIFLNFLGSDKKKVKENDIQKAYDEMILQLDPDFNTQFDKLSDLEKEIMIALAMGFDNYTAIAREIRKLPSSLPKTVLRLLNQDIVEKHRDGKYRITDPIFADWLQRKYATLSI